MSRAAYYTSPCPVCRKEVTTGGLGRSSHMKTHLVSGEMVAERNGMAGKVYYDPPAKDEKPLVLAVVSFLKTAHADQKSYSDLKLPAWVDNDKEAMLFLVADLRNQARNDLEYRLTPTRDKLIAVWKRLLSAYIPELKEESK